MASLAKTHARAWIQKRLCENFVHKSRSACEILMLPEMGREIPMLQKKGFKKLHCVEREKDVFNAATWVGKDGVEAHLGDIGEVALKMAENGTRIDAALLDLCGTTSGKMITTIENVLLGGCMASRSFASITLMKGREDPAIINALRCLEDNGVTFPHHKTNFTRPLLQPANDDVARVKILLANVQASRTLEDMEIFAYQNGAMRMICVSFMMLPGQRANEMDAFDDFVRDKSRSNRFYHKATCVGKDSAGRRCNVKASGFCLCGAPLCVAERGDRILPEHYANYCMADHSTKKMIANRK